MRITLAILCLALAAGLSCWTGYGRGYMGLVALITVYLVLSALPERGRALFWRAFLWASVAASVLAIAQLPWLDRVTGPFGSPNYLGAFAVVAFFIAWREQHPVMAAINLAAGACTQSRGALLALAAGLAVLLWRRSRYLAIATAAIAPVGIVLIQRSIGTDARLEVWQLGLQAAAQRPLTGWGIGWTTPLVVIGNNLMELDHFYSVPLDCLVATGALGLAAGCWVTVEAWLLARGPLACQIVTIGQGYGPPGGVDRRIATCHSSRAALVAWIVAGLCLSASWPMWLVLFALLADISATSYVPDTPATEPAAAGCSA